MIPLCQEVPRSGHTGRRKTAEVSCLTYAEIMLDFEPKAEFYKRRALSLGGQKGLSQDNSISWQSARDNKGVRFHLLAIILLAIAFMLFISSFVCISLALEGWVNLMLLGAIFLVLAIPLDKKSRPRIPRLK